MGHFAPLVCSAMPATPQPEPLYTVLGPVSPLAMWEAIAASKAQYILVGDSNHLDPAIKENFVPVMAMLADAGVRHLALEWPDDPYKDIIGAFNAAGAKKRKDTAGLQELVTRFMINPVPASDGNASVAKRHRNANAALVFAARQNGVQIATLNRDMLEISDFMSRESLQVRERLTQGYRHYYMHGTLLADFTQPETDTLMKHAYDHLQYNLSLDNSRARHFMHAAQHERAAIVFGALHFRGANGDGIDAFLPQNRVAYVLMGESDFLQQHRYNNDDLPQRTPDFVVATDLKLAFVTTEARKNGLIPG